MANGNLLGDRSNNFVVDNGDDCNDEESKEKELDDNENGSNDLELIQCAEV